MFRRLASYHPPALGPNPPAVFFFLLAISAGLASGCATSSGQARGPSRVGVVSLHGAEQMLALDLQGSPLELSGSSSLISQLDRIVDARVRVWGRFADGGVRVRDFEMLEAPDGLAPYIGRVVVDQSGVVLRSEATGARLALQGAELRSLRRQHGARVWVTGSIVDSDILLIAHWGVLVPAPGSQGAAPVDPDRSLSASRPLVSPAGSAASGRPLLQPSSLRKNSS